MNYLFNVPIQCFYITKYPEISFASAGCQTLNTGCCSKQKLMSVYTT